MTVRASDERGERRAADEFVRAAAGDRAAFAAFLARFEPRIVRIVRALVPREDAEDVFQEVCLRLVAKGRLYDASRPLVPWLDAVTRQVCATAHRRRSCERRARSVESLEEVVAADRAGGDPWIRDAVQDHLASLSGSERDALRLVLVSGLTQREAAKRLGVPAGTVAGWLAKAVRALRARLGGRGGVE